MGYIVITPAAKLIAKMPPTDSNGSSRVTTSKTQDTVYLKEIISNRKGYVVPGFFVWR